MLAASVLTGCDTEVDESDSLGNAVTVENEGEIDPFGEEVSFRCVLNGYYHDADPLELTIWSIPWPGGALGSMSSISPTNTYINPGCGDYYVIHATEVDDPFVSFNYLWAEPFWAESIPNQSRCIWSVLYYDIAVKRGNTWYQRTAHYDVGNWNGSHCEIGGPIMISNPYGDIERVQVAVRGLYMDQNGQHYAKVGAEVISSDDPP